MRNYHFATAALSDGDFMGVFARIASVGCFSLAGLCALLQVHPAGPNGVSARVVQALVALSAVAVGARWLWWSWPTYRHAVAFAVWLDVSLTVLALTTSDPVAALCVTMFLGLNGVFVAFLLGWRTLSVHLVFCAAVITAIVAYSVHGDRDDLATVLLLLAPTLAWVLVVPKYGGLLVERGRSAMRKTARSALNDPLTGLRNRRGMYAAIHTALAHATGPVTVIAAVCDIDKFKHLNDENGHAVGDAALIEMAQRLKSLATSTELTARIGGDELILVSIRPTTTGTDTQIAELHTRLEPLTRLDMHGLALTASVGIAAHSTAERHFTTDDVLRHADAAMYDAKRSGGAACALYRDGVTEPTADKFRRSSRPSRLT
ncbi:GGDEF domain-containing protein [Mycolicibacterium fortuitum]|uniref:GGDEF domain-containing protein n=1 Tax=Mycolicibacterium fortuitum TaxID=1766 RepID=UPI00241E8F78|nr:GGDEF domain-containing protein [Mycolicibacterium fortuitum]MDG5769369.1 GGDEF domain-containing protein [Mycolicibacterium fortuitum]MDG5780400.1 GGDEF domain-containing protein [Mycolicibacterium fortuitum]